MGVATRDSVNTSATSTCSRVKESFNAAALRDPTPSHWEGVHGRACAAQAQAATPAMRSRGGKETPCADSAAEQVKRGRQGATVVGWTGIGRRPCAEWVEPRADGRSRPAGRGRPGLRVRIADGGAGHSLRRETPGQASLGHTGRRRSWVGCAKMAAMPLGCEGEGG
jgi:hypothetical protein